MIRQFEIIEKIKSYDAYANEDLLNKAYVFSMKAHGSQKRASGDPYFLHPLEVAGILTDLKLDWRTIVTALLHDTVEDTVATLEEIEKLFGEDIADLVDGVTKLSKIEQQSVKKTQAENFRKFLLAMSKDIRVLLVKLADRLHNMRTLHHIKSEEKRLRIAKETMDIFAPLAGRIGLQNMRNELESLSFSFTHPKELSTIQSRLNFLQDEGKEVVQGIIETLKKTVTDAGVKAEISGRQKNPYSIWKKIQIKNIPFESLSDIIAFRILVPNIDECYKILGIIHNAYAAVSSRFKDYISTPKPNNYKSIHTTVLIPPYQRVEVQIRTSEMHREAELGVAAHWVYKEVDKPTQKDASRYEWIRSLLDILDQAEDPDQFLEHTKMEMFRDEVFCFSPNGDIVTLPKGSSPVDFAYAVHSDVGNQCAGSKINGKLMPLRTKLHNGDQVEILTSPHHEPSPTWDRFVITGKAHAHIRRFIRNKEKVQYRNLGHAMLLKKARKFKILFKEKDLKAHLSSFKVTTLEEIYILIGKAAKCAQKVLESVYPETFNIEKRKTTKNLSTLSSVHKNTKTNDESIINGLITRMAIHFAKCCYPIPGDTISGAISTGKGVVIHRESCKTLEQFSDNPEKVLDLDWDQKAKNGKVYLAHLHIIIENSPGKLGALTTFMGGSGANISNLHMLSRSSDFVDIHMDIDVANTQELESIVALLRTTKLVSEVSRA